MRFKPWKCPECGQQAKGTLETIPGIALLLFDEDGNAQYAGETAICWDGQATVCDEYGRVTLDCPDGHAWLAMINDTDDATAASTPQGG
ncbi:MAG: hypothetical protein ACYTG0_36440 [Planctomycetota bacterium]|jgi:hypothetical protein